MRDPYTIASSGISLGGSLNYAAINPVIVAGREMLEQGSFQWLAGSAKAVEIKQLLSIA